NTLHITRWQSGEFQSVWHEADVLPVLRPLPSEGDVRLTCPGGVPRGIVTLWRESADSPRFLLRFDDGVRSCRRGPKGLDKGKVVTEHEALGNPPAVKKSPEQVVWDGAKLVTLVDGKEVYRYVPPAPITYLAPPPLVADLAGKRRILVRDATGNYLLVSAAGPPSVAARPAAPELAKADGVSYACPAKAPTTSNAISSWPSTDGPASNCGPAITTAFMARIPLLSWPTFPAPSSITTATAPTT